MKKKLKKLGLKKQTLHLLNGRELYAGQGGAATYQKNCAESVVTNCTPPSQDSRCPSCWGLA